MLPVAHFIDAAVTPAGDAWLLAEDRDRRTEVVHLAPDGTIAEEDVTADAGFAIGANATDVWIATEKAVWHRGADGVWGPIVVDEPPRWITAIGPGRALVQTPGDRETHARIVEATGAQPVTALGRRVERAVPDGVGGAWASIADGVDPIGLAHLTAAGDWEEWSLRAAAYDHMQIHPGPPAGLAPLYPRGDGGVIATRPEAFVVLDATGAVRETLPREPPPANARVAGLVVLDGKLAAVAVRFSTTDEVDARPLVLTGRHTDVVPATSVWREGHPNGMRPVAVASGGATAVIVGGDTAFYRVGASGWHSLDTIDRRRYAPDPHGTRSLFSMPLDLGGTTRDDGSFSIGLRPELVIARGTDHPHNAFGAFAEILSVDHHTVAGGGFTAVHYFHAGAGLGVSAGLDNVWASGAHAQPVFSAFFGARPTEGGIPLDSAFGFRVDYRPATGPLPATTTVSACIDLALVGYGALLLGALASIHH